MVRVRFSGQGGFKVSSASEAGLFKLIIEDDEGHTTIVPLVKEEITIGRKEGNTIRLTERNVSRHHARLIKSNGTVFVEDLDSYNGVKVNGDKITARTNVREGDLIEIGDYHFALQWIDEQALPPTPSGVPPIPKLESPPALPQSQARAPTQMDGPTAVLKLPLDDKAEDRGRVRTIPEKEAGRLVIVTTELAGSEFPLTRSEMLIGRTEENDVVLAHRSVSSRHAKIVYDGGIYRIIDMDSANGVLVNGEEYARVDLRRGDTIELGHVRIRYVAPGEVYQYAPDQAAEMVTEVTQPEVVDASILEERLEKPPKGKKIGLITGGVALAALIAFGIYHFTRPGEGPGGEPAATEPAATEPEPAPPLEPAEEDPAAVTFKEGTAKLGQRDFEGAIVAFNATLEKNPEYPGVQTMLEKARAEKENSEMLSKAQAAIAEKDYDAAWEYVAQISSDSIFAKETEALRPEVRTKYVSFHLNKAKKYMDSGMPEKALKHVESVLIVDEKNTYAKNLRNQIGKMKKPPAVAVVEKEPRIPKKPPPPKRSKKKELGELLDKGKKAVRTKRYADAVSAFKSVLKLEPRSCDALVSIGIVYARWGKREKSYIYYKKFLESCPKHMQAPQVRQIVQQFEDWKRQNR
jgi:pSer/pThr/pTyr-binding forkhead associated (FHA) protein/tetratricopeptide (TPR) repeat protein